MREIKFRAWTKDEMIYEGWNNNFHVTKEIIFRYEDVMQFTGLKDKNGKEIYEGDIVRHGDATSEVIFEDGSFAVSYKSKVCLRHHDMSVFEVIGNIHENPEQLKQ